MNKFKKKNPNKQTNKTKQNKKLYNIHMIVIINFIIYVAYDCSLVFFVSAMVLWWMTHLNAVYYYYYNSYDKPGG